MEEEPAVSHRSYYMERTEPSMTPSKAGPGRKVDNLHYTIWKEKSDMLWDKLNNSVLMSLFSMVIKISLGRMCLCFRKHLIMRISKMWTGQKKQKPNALNQWKEDRRLLIDRENSKAAGIPHPRHNPAPPPQGPLFHHPHSLHNSQNPPHKCSGHLKTQPIRYQLLMLAWKRWRKWCHNLYRVWQWRAFKGDHWSLETQSPPEVCLFLDAVLITN